MSTTQGTAKTRQKQMILFAIVTAALIALFSIISTSEDLQGSVMSDAKNKCIKACGQQWRCEMLGGPARTTCNNNLKACNRAC